MKPVSLHSHRKVVLKVEARRAIIDDNSVSMEQYSIVDNVSDCRVKLNSIRHDIQIFDTAVKDCQLNLTEIERRYDEYKATLLYHQNKVATLEARNNVLFNTNHNLIEEVARLLRKIASYEDLLTTRKALSRILEQLSFYCKELDKVIKPL